MSKPATPHVGIGVDVLEVVVVVVVPFEYGVLEVVVVVVVPLEYGVLVVEPPVG